MGLCVSRNDPQSVKSKVIDSELKKHSGALYNQVKILLLGPGESGKSTVFKQMKILQINGGFSTDELLNYKTVIYANCVSQMKVLINAAANLQIKFGSQESVKTAEKLLQLQQQGTQWSMEMGALIKMLWKDEGIRSVYDMRGSKFQLNDTAEYFFDNIDRISSDNYLPSVDDVLRVRIRSTGIEEAEFLFEKLTFTMVDVGGQRSERRKWIHCFDNVTAILFCAALSEYDQTLREDNSQNRMAETMLLFDEVANSKHFSKNSIILFLNKTDLFSKKIIHVPLTVCFKDYTGNTEEQAREYINERFLERAPSQTVYTHFTCALNSKNIQFVINAIRDKLLDNFIVDIGIQM